MRTFWVLTWARIKDQLPVSIRKRRLNFISAHYLHIISMTIMSSIIIFASGDIPYIDALFFASGAATQSGLNTLDVNKINTAQQMVLYFEAMLCNPIFIHSFVVFVRLYWFEKRFQNVVQEARALRRTKSKSRNNTQAKDDLEANLEAKSIRGRNIVLLRNEQSHMIESPREKDESPAHEQSASSSSKTRRNSGEEYEETNHNAKGTARRDSDAETQRLPQQLSPDQHIAFLENQRNPKDKLALRIPSPREFDRGGKPEAVQDEEGAEIHYVNSSTPIEPQTGNTMNMDSRLRSNPPMRQHITIDEPNIPRARTKTATFSRLQSRSGTAEGKTKDDDPAPMFSRSRSRRSTFSNMLRSATERTEEPMPYLSWEPTIGRNSMFVNLTEEQREELGGIEYRALKTLALTLTIYFFAFHLFAIISLVPWIMHSKTYGDIVRADGVGRPWWGIFTAGSAFNDLGFTLTPDSMISFATAVWPLLLMSFLIIIGNTGFPCMLRFVIWVASKLTPRGTGLWEELKFLLDHPRRCFTLLFPKAATWWLFAILVVLNGVDLIFYIILDLNDTAVTAFPVGIRLLDGLFQASSTRTAGFSVVNLADLHPAIQVSYLIMMYISVFPIAISMRRTNVYEERSLGIYGSANEETDDDREPSYVGAHLRKQLSFDLWYVFLGLFIIAIVEGGHLQNTKEVAFTLFSVLFEIVSAYGTVGLSLGYPNTNASFSAQFAVLSKLVIIAMQIRGRHRGLPYAVDRAIILPSEGQHRKEEQEGEKRLRRRGSAMSDMSGVSGLRQGDIGLSTATDARNGGDQIHNGSAPLRGGLGSAMAKLAAHPRMESVKRTLGSSNATSYD